ncbi:hypothetical protein [Anaerolactibacter massiliensis]|uniref:hypothetical protein n=1 Tax=Anaerolactibacter massiliensis TaxID=2044573 RepID=UPI00107F892C|nr:hypothetical protein [Anaerolactibacter massiliensis]
MNDIINCLFDDDGFISPERNAEVRQFSMNAIARGICAFQTSDDIGRDFTIRASALRLTESRTRSSDWHTGQTQASLLLIKKTLTFRRDFFYIKI